MSQESNPEGRRLHWIFGTALLAQASCWLWATPGPFLRGQEQSFEAAATNSLMAFAWLFALPLLVAWWLGVPLGQLGLKVGAWKRGLITTSLALPFVVLFLFFGCDDPEIKVAYPWAGQWLAQSLGNMAAWFSIYLLYYVAFEFFFRGFLMKGLEQDLGLAAAMWVQVILSVSIHFGKPTPEIIGAIPAGFLFGWIAHRTDSILYVILIHWVIGIFNDLFAMHHNGWF